MATQATQIDTEFNTFHQFETESETLLGTSQPVQKTRPRKRITKYIIGAALLIVGLYFYNTTSAEPRLKQMLVELQPEDVPLYVPKKGASAIEETANGMIFRANILERMNGASRDASEIRHVANTWKINVDREDYYGQLEEKDLQTARRIGKMFATYILRKMEGRYNTQRFLARLDKLTNDQVPESGLRASGKQLEFWKKTAKGLTYFNQPRWVTKEGVVSKKREHRVVAPKDQNKWWFGLTLGRLLFRDPDFLHG